MGDPWQKKLRGPAQREVPQVQKVPKTDSSFNKVDKALYWCFSIFDHDKDWRKAEDDEKTFRHVGKRMKDIASRSWGDIDRNHKRDHFVEVYKLEKEAQKRLRELKQDDVCELLRLRGDGTERFWGISQENIFKVIWWDPDHMVCPSHLKNT